MTSGTTPCIVFLMIADDGCVWLSERTGCETFNGYWQGGGGRVNRFEAVCVAAARELKEETGLTCSSRLLYLGCDEKAVNSRGEPFPLHCYTINLLPEHIPQNTEPELHGPWTKFNRTETAKLKLMPGLKHRWFEDWIDARET